MASILALRVLENASILPSSSIELNTKEPKPKNHHRSDEPYRASENRKTVAQAVERPLQFAQTIIDR